MNNQDTDSEYECSRSLWIGIPIRAMISRPMMYRPFVVQRNLPDGLSHTILLNVLEQDVTDTSIFNKYHPNF